MEGVSVEYGAIPPNLGVPGKRLSEVIIHRRIIGLRMPGNELFDCDVAVIGSHSLRYPLKMQSAPRFLVAVAPTGDLPNFQYSHHAFGPLVAHG